MAIGLRRLPLRTPFGHSLHKKECSEAANFDFETSRRLSAAKARRLLQRVRERLHAPLRSLADSRRRRTFRYTPWALVTVEDRLESRAKAISCAYEYGVPQASGQFYSGDGPYSPEVWKAEGVAKHWGNESSRPCWVRTQGQAGGPGEYCSVAMMVPGSLKKQAAEQQDLSPKEPTTHGSATIEFSQHSTAS